MSKHKTQKLVVSPREVKDYGGPGHTKVYELIASGELRARKMGSRTFILVSDLLAWLEGLPEVKRARPSASSQGALLEDAARSKASRIEQ